MPIRARDPAGGKIRATTPAAIAAIGKIRIEKVVKVMLPMYAGMVFVLLLVTFVPQISLWIPNLLMPGAK